MVFVPHYGFKWRTDVIWALSLLFSDFFDFRIALKKNRPKLHFAICFAISFAIEIAIFNLFWNF